MIGSRLNIVRNPSCDRLVSGFEYIAMSIDGASRRLLLPTPLAERSRLPPTDVYRKNIVPCSISWLPSPYVFIHAYIGDESGSHELPDPSRDIASPMFIDERIVVPCSE